MTAYAADLPKSKITGVVTADGVWSVTDVATAAVKDPVRFYCGDATAAKCADLLKGFEANKKYYIHAAVTAAATASLRETADGTAVKKPSAAVATAPSSMADIWLLKDNGTTTAVAAPAAGTAGSAARSLAMLGSVFGIFAAMLLA